MGIRFLNASKIFILENKEFSYIFYINHLNILTKLYFGKRINDLSINSFNYINNLNADSYNFLDLKEDKEIINSNPYFSGLTSEVEAPSFLTFDKRGSLVSIKHKDNSLLTDFRYVSHKVYKKEFEIEGLPYFNKKSSETLEITLKDIKDDIYLVMYYSVYEDLNVILRHNEVINKSSSDIEITNFSSFCLDLPSLDYDLLSVYGTYATDRILERQKLTHNIISLTENSGGKGFYHNPMCMLIKENANDDFGEVIGLGLVYSSNFKFDFIGSPLNKLRVLVGINNEDFNIKLKKNEKFITPEGIIVYSNEGINKVTHTFHDAIRKHLLRKVPSKFKNTILLNSWEATGFDFDTLKIKSFIKKAKEMDINLFVLDDGWFGKRNDDTTSLGDWNINLEKINLKEVIDYAHSLNMKFGLWIEPEMISFNSELFKKHPEYVLFDKSVNPTTLRHQLVLDLTIKEVRDYIFESIEKIFDNYEIDYCKWDFNRIITEPISQMSSENNDCLYHKFILGTYDLLSRFIRCYPNILLETCAGGGGRFDLGMLFYSHQIWGSDETDGVSRTLIQYATNLFYPLKVIGSHISARKYLSIKEKGAIAMFGTFGYELDVTKLNEEEIEEVKIANFRFLNNKKLIDEGDYYPLISPYNNNFVSWEVVSEDKKELIFFFMNYKQVNRESRFIKLKGLDKNKYYINDFDNLKYRGDFYMNIGLNLSIGMQSFTPILIKLKETD